MEPFTVAGLAALVVKLMTVVKAVSAKSWNMAVTQIVAWVAGVFVAWLASESDVTAGLTPIDGGSPLGAMDFGSVVLVGVGLASLASFAYDIRKSADNTDSAREPQLLNGTPPPP